MAVTFSKNGKPMGRSKSTPERNNKQWSADEDNYLRIAVKEGLSTSVVSSRLGRTPASIQTRKWILGIEGRLASSRGKKGERVARHATKRNTNPNQMQMEFAPGIMELESNIPVPTKHNRNDEARDKMRNLFNQMKVGQSFVVPKNLVHVANYLVKNEFESYKTKSTATSPDKKFYRIFRVA